MITNNNSSQLAATKESSMVWMEGRKHQDNRRFLGIVSKRTMLLLLMGLVAFGGAPVLGSRHRVRLDLKIRSPDVLKEKAESMSKPFPYQGNPLSWNEIIDIVGRTDAEMNDLVTTITNDLGGTEIETCPSKQCIIADVDVDVNEDKDSNETVEDFLHRSLRRILLDSGTDHTIINGITRLTMPDIARNGNAFRKVDRILADDNKNDSAPSQNSVFATIYSEIFLNRLKNITEESLNLNGVMFLVIPAICAVDSETGYFSMEKNSDQQKSCPTEIKVTASPWYANDLAICENSEESYLPSFSQGHVISIADSQGNATFQFRDDTILRKLELDQLFDAGAAYYKIHIEYPDYQINTISSSVYAVIGPTITPRFGNMRYNVPEGHQAVGLGVIAPYYGLPYAFSEDALESLLTLYNLPVPNINLITSTTFPSNNLTACYDGCFTANYVLQTFASYGVGAEVGFVPGGGPQGPISSDFVHENFVKYREAFIENGIKPDVLSLSWTDTEWSLSEELEHILMEFTAAGITVLAETGDRGAGGATLPGAEYGAQCNPTEYSARVQLPASSPWVLAVGSTMEAKLPESNGLGPAACMGPISQKFTSTGFIFPSDLLELPEYQKNAVEGYMNSDAYQHWPFQPSIDKPGRGIPDVSAYGNNIPVVFEDKAGNLVPYSGSGTGLSTPTFAGLLLQVRGALLASPECEGKNITLFGHINPMIYWAAENRPGAFTDITVGNNIFDGAGDVAQNTAYCGQGYVATEGWDPVTGNGMMNFPGFVAAAKEYYCIGIKTANPTPGPSTMQPVLTPSNLTPSCAVAEGFCVPTGTPDGSNLYCCNPLRCKGGVCNKINKKKKTSKKSKNDKQFKV